MKFQNLIYKSEIFLNEECGKDSPSFSGNVFTDGAVWMSANMNILNPPLAKDFNSKPNYNLYGVMKYGVCLFAFFVSFILFLKIHFLLTILSFFIFYLCEIHFLFLFPLLLDRHPSPLLSSIKLTYQLGIVKLLSITVPIGIMMMAGLLNYKNPLYNWKKGCLAVLIWYNDEVRDRL